MPNAGTAAIDWRSVEEARRELEDCNAFLDAAVAEEEGKRLRMPVRNGEGDRDG